MSPTQSSEVRVEASPPDGPGVLDRTSPLPLWAQLLTELRGKLVSGDYDAHFPTERELMAAYGVSRNTVREAVRRLGAEGLIERHRGRGTQIRRAELEQPLGALYSFFHAIESQGMEQVSQVRALEVRRDAEVARRLGLANHADLVYLERLRLADNAPLALDRSWLPAELTRPLLRVDFSRTSLYRELAVRCGIGPLGGEERIRPAIPSAGLRALLRLEPGTAVFAVERLARSAERPVEFRISTVRGDRYSFVARWSAGSVAPTA